MSKSEYYCKPCKRDFVDRVALTQHQDAIHDWVCDYCEDEFDFESQVDAHIKRYHSTRCDDCSQSFGSQQALDSHNSAKHSLKCKHCDRVFRNGEARSQHEESPVHIQICSNCGQRFTSKEGLDKHCAENHLCDLCPPGPGATFPNKAALKTHRKSLHQFKCAQCFITTTTFTMYQEHIKLHGFKCSRCSQTFKTEVGMLGHLADEHAIPCKFCNLNFEDNSKYMIHLKDAHRLKCDHCSSEFKSQEDLEDHVTLKHTFRCQQCPEHSLSQAQLEEHITEKHFTGNHSSETHDDKALIFKCSCTQKFKRMNDLSLHFREMHENQCLACKIPFISPQAVLSHLKTAHMHTCVDCEAAFESKVSLDMHKKKMHNFLCSQCEEGFINKVGLEAHVIAVHQDLGLFICMQCLALCEGDDAFSGPSQIHDESAKLESTRTKKMENSETFIECSNCEMRFDKQTDFAHHFLNEHYLRCKECTGLRFASLQELSEHTAKAHMPVITSSTSTQTEAVLSSEDSARAVSLGVDAYNTSFDATDEDIYHDARSLANSPERIGRDKPCQGRYKLAADTLIDLSSLTGFESSRNVSATTDFTVATDQSSFDWASLHVSQQPPQQTPTQVAQDWTTEAHPDFVSHQSATPPRPSPVHEGRQMFTQTSIHRCDECIAVFDDKSTLESHFLNSPFHKPIGLMCTECHIGPYKNQIELLHHIESKAHRTKWVLSML